MSEGVTWFKHDVPEDVAEMRGKVIAEALLLPKVSKDLFAFSELEDDGVRFIVDSRERTHAGLYRAILTAIAEADPRDYEKAEPTDQQIMEEIDGKDMEILP